MSEDVNVEHLLRVFASIDSNPDVLWDACISFLRHLSWHKPREAVLKSTIEGLSDDHDSKPHCLSELSVLFQMLGNYEEQKRLLTHTLTLARKHGDDFETALTLGRLSSANRGLGLYKEGMQQAKEASEILERFPNTAMQARCSERLSLLLLEDN